MMIAHNFLDGKVVEGRHEPLVSKEIFLQANGMLKNNHQKYKHEKENESLPLKRFVKCGECGTSFAGYEVKKRGIHYYKCNRKGCKCNRNAKEMHEGFMDFIGRYTMNPEYIEPYKDALHDIFFEMNKENKDNQDVLEKQLKEINGKIEMIEERYVLREITKDMYDKFNGRFCEEKREILGQLQQMDFSLSNVDAYIDFSLDLSVKLQKMWHLSDFQAKEKLQYLVFPEGIFYDRKNATYRTERTNVVFELIYSFTEEIKNNKKGQTSDFTDLSLSVPRRRLELLHRLRLYHLKVARLPISPPGQLFPVFFVIPDGFEPSAHSLEGCCSIQLSYGTKIRARKDRKWFWINK